MRLFRFVLCVSILVATVGCSASDGGASQCCSHSDHGHHGCFPSAGRVGETRSMVDVRGMYHHEAIEALEPYFENICCDGSSRHYMHATDARIWWQDCKPPNVMDIGDIVYLSTDPKGY